MGGCSRRQVPRDLGGRTRRSMQRDLVTGQAGPANLFDGPASILCAPEISVRVWNGQNTAKCTEVRRRLPK
jgi:hypothetical protein